MSSDRHGMDEIAVRSYSWDCLYIAVDDFCLKKVPEVAQGTQCASGRARTVQVYDAL